MGTTGLGLTIVEQAIDLHDGAIDGESEPGSRTTFEVRLPGAGRGGTGDDEAG